MLDGLRRTAKKSRTLVILHHLYDNWLARSQFNSGSIETESGTTHASCLVESSTDYINRVFEDYLAYAGLSQDMLQGKRVLELGPGDNAGVALKFLLAGARQVVCLDRFFSKRDERKHSQIYQALREPLNEEQRLLFDQVLDPLTGLSRDPQKLLLIFGTPIEEAEKILQPESFDLVVSRAVLEHVYDTDQALAVIHRLLARGGYMIHKIDLRDHGMFSGNHHPLTFLTIADTVYRLMTRDSGKPNRRLIGYYRRKMRELDFDATFLITQIVGEEREIVPHKEKVVAHVDYADSASRLVDQIRPRLQAEFKQMTNEDLLVSGIFLVAKKR
jgi:SAM-dependent methyltransferase